MWAQPKEPREKFEMLRNILKERYPNGEITTEEYLTPCGFTMSKEKYEEISKRGPFGRIGPGTDFTKPLPSSEYFLRITVRANLEKIDKLKKIPVGTVSEDTNGIWNQTMKIMTEKKKYIKHRRVIKKPCFHALYVAMLKINPNYTEEEMIGEEINTYGEYEDVITFNKNVVDDIIYTTTVVEEKYDPVYGQYILSVMYNDIDTHLDSILKDLDSLLL